MITVIGRYVDRKKGYVRYDLSNEMKVHISEIKDNKRESMMLIVKDKNCKQLRIMFRVIELNKDYTYCESNFDLEDELDKDIMFAMKGTKYDIERFIKESN